MVEPGSDFYGQMSRRMKGWHEENFILDIIFMLMMLAIILGCAMGTASC